MPSHPFSLGRPPEIPPGSLRQRADAYIHSFPDHWGKKTQLKALRDQLRFAAFGSGVDTSVTKAKLTDLLDFLDGMYELQPRGPRGPDNPWWPA